MGGRTDARSGPGRLTFRLAALSLVCTGAMALHAQAQQPPVTPDDFVAAAGGSDQYEVMAARLALVASKDAQVRAFAQDMARDHAAMAASLRESAMRSGLKPPSTSVGSDQAGMLAALQSLRGPQFDRAYVRQQILAHQQALVTERGYARDGSDPNLRALAKADVPMINHHLQTGQNLQRPAGD